MDGCRSEARTISQPSVPPGGELAEFFPQDLAMRESMSTEWTDEKHSLYLKSMEASFVNQLYNSIDLLDLQLPKEMSDPSLLQQAHYNTSASSGQFKVLRGSCWKKINFRRPDSQIKVKKESHGFLMSPWIQHFKSARKSQVTNPESDASQCQTTNLSMKKTASSGRATCSKHSYICCCHSCRHGLVESNTEVSDQNFVDEYIESEKKSSTCSSKRLKTEMTGASSNDQVADDRRYI